MNGILTPHVLERWKNDRLALIAHLRVASNDGELDESEPPLREEALSWIEFPDVW